MNTFQFKNRTKAFAIDVIQFIKSLPRTNSSMIIGKQLFRCATSVGANYRSACRARSRADFIAKMGIVEEECDESMYWMELLIDINEADPKFVGDLIREADEISSMVVASIKTARFNK